MRVEAIVSINNALNAFTWGPVMLVFFIATGVYLSVKTGFVQLRLGLVFKSTLGSLFKKREKGADGALTPFQAMTTGLAGTVGTGNIVLDVGVGLFRHVHKVCRDRPCRALPRH